MSHGERGQALARVWALIRTHKRKCNNGRCWQNDIALYKRTVGTRGSGRMDLPEKVLFRNCKRYIRGQQCSLKKCH